MAFLVSEWYFYSKLIFGLNMSKSKIVLFFSGLIVSGSILALTPTTEPMQNVVEIISLDGKNKDQIYEGSKVWLAKSFKSANSVIQYQNPETGSIIGKGNIQFPCKGFIDCGAFGNDKVNFTIQIDVKDNKARLSISDITATSGTYVRGGINNLGSERPINILEHQQRITEKLKDVVQQYKTDLSQKSQSNDW